MLALGGTVALADGAVRPAPATPAAAAGDGADDQGPGHGADEQGTRLMARVAGEAVPAGEATRGEYRAPAVEKALDVLEFMARQPDGLTQTEIALGLGRSIHEIYRILHQLERRGYLIRSRADRYRLSLKMFELAHMHAPVNRLVAAALPAMRKLVSVADQSCHLVVLNGLTVVVVAQADSPLPMRYSVALGARFPALETSSGAVLIAGMEADRAAETIDRIFAAGQAIGSRAEVEDRLALVRRNGCEVHASFAVAGCTNISLPVRDHTGTVAAALTVPFLPQKAARFDQAAVRAAATTAAAEISAALGAPESVQPLPAPADRQAAAQSASPGSRGRKQPRGCAG